jgi:hypothetical protein
MEGPTPADPGPGRDPDSVLPPSGRAPAYAGIGSRETPADMLALIEALAARVAAEGRVLRTGLSPGADQAFYRGAVGAGGAVELYLPWPGFEAQARVDGAGELEHVLPQPTAAACELAARFHPRWEALAADERKLLARDCHEVLGADLRSPAGCVVCWTADGSIDGAGLYADGTGQALRIAHAHGVPVLNLARPEHLERLVGP